MSASPFIKRTKRPWPKRFSFKTESYYAPWKRWFENRIYPSPDGISVFFQEITERVQAERAARENAELLRGQNQALELIAQGRLSSKHSICSCVGSRRRVRACCARSCCSIRMEYTCAIARLRPCRRVTPALSTANRSVRAPAPAGRRLSAARTVVVEDIATDPLWDDYRDFALSTACAPAGPLPSSTRSGACSAPSLSTSARRGARRKSIGN